MRDWRAVTVCGAVSVALAALCGCATTPSDVLAVPSPDDSLALRDYYRELKPSQSKCHPAVPVLSEAEVGGRTYHEVGSLSATCYPGAPAVCKRTLSESACAHQADAAILVESAPGGSPPGASGQAQVSMSARAIRWD